MDATGPADVPPSYARPRDDRLVDRASVSFRRHLRVTTWLAELAETAVEEAALGPAVSQVRLCA